MTTRDPYASTPPGTTSTPRARSMTEAQTQQGGGGAGSEGTTEQVKEKASEAVDQAKRKTGQLVEQATEQAKPRLESQKERAAGSLSTTAQALRQTGQQLREQEEGPVAQFAERAAEQVERVAGYLREKDITQLVSEVEDFARRQPALFLGGAFALGLLSARFLKSSGQQARQGGGSQGRAQGAGAASPPGYQPAGYQPEVTATSGSAMLPETNAFSLLRAEGPPVPPAATVPPLSAEGALAETMPSYDTAVRPSYSPEREAR